MAIMLSEDMILILNSSCSIFKSGTALGLSANDDILFEKQQGRSCFEISGDKREQQGGSLIKKIP